MKFKKYDYVDTKLYAVYLGKHRFALSVSGNKRSYTFTYAEMIDDSLYNVKYYKNLKL